MKYNHYNPNLKAYAHTLRTKSVSRAEKYLWVAVLSGRKTGERFLRQRPMDRFIVDFFAPELKLIIEIDGSSHEGKEDYDRYRQERLESLGYLVIRFSEGRVLNSLKNVRAEIMLEIENIKSGR